MNDLDALRAAKLLLDAHGAAEAGRILVSRAAADRPEHLAITPRVEAALRLLTDAGAGRTRQ